MGFWRREAFVEAPQYLFDETYGFLLWDLTPLPKRRTAICYFPSITISTTRPHPHSPVPHRVLGICRVLGHLDQDLSAA